MYTQSLLTTLALLTSTFANPIPQSSTPNIQYTIQGVQTGLNVVINDIVRSDIHNQQVDYLDVTGLLGGIYSTVVGPSGGTCPPASPTPATNATTAIQYIQTVQLDLNVVALAIIDSASASELKSDMCGVLALWDAVRHFVFFGPGTSSSSATATGTVAPPFTLPTATTSPTVAPPFTLPTTSATITSGPTNTTATSLVCNPAHSYPTPLTCVLGSNGPSFSTVTPAATSNTGTVAPPFFFSTTTTTTRPTVAPGFPEPTTTSS